MFAPVALARSRLVRWVNTALQPIGIGIRDLSSKRRVPVLCASELRSLVLPPLHRRFAKPHPWSAAVLVDELDAC
jgi:hypothetical protein